MNRKNPIRKKKKNKKYYPFVSNFLETELESKTVDLSNEFYYALFSKGFSEWGKNSFGSHTKDNFFVLKR